MNRCAVTSTSLAPSTTLIYNTVSTTLFPTMEPHNYRPLKLYIVACIVMGGILSISVSVVGGWVVFKMWSKRRPQHKLRGLRQSDSIIELGQVNNLPTGCDQGGQASCQSGRDEKNDSLQVQVPDESVFLESAGDILCSGASFPDNQIRESQNLETLSGCEGTEFPGSLEEVQPVSTLEQSQSQEDTVPPAGEIRDIPGSLPIVQSNSENHQSNVRTPNSQSRIGRQSRQDSGLAMMSPLSDMRTHSSAQSRSYPSRGIETSLLLSIDDFQVVSNELMFLGPVRSLVCDSRGGRFLIPEHGITLAFPQGAIPDTIQLEVDVGVAIHGLFNFPDNLRPISVLVWVQAKQQDFEFQRAVEILLPHYLKLSREDVHNSSNLGLGFMVTDGEEDEHHNLIFKEGAKDQVSYKQTQAIISTTHFCYMCLSAKTSVITEKSSYLLSQVQPELITSLRWQIHFCVSYDLCSFVAVSPLHSCMQVHCRCTHLSICT